jgi:ribose-phosphate pyrophosphokinase
MSHRPLTLFGLNRSIELAQRVAECLEIPLGLHEEREFEDGEHKARPLQTVRGHDVFVLHSLHGEPGASGNDKLCRLLFFCNALKDAGAARVTAVTPYLCYARKDRRTKPDDPITTRYIAALFEAVGIDEVIAFEVHNVAAFENAFRCPTMHLESAPLLAAHLAPVLAREKIVVLSPDAGGAKRAESFRAAMEVELQRDVGNAIMEKFRSSGVVSGSLLAGDVRDRTVVIVDDMISTGGTLIRAAVACHRAGAARVIAAAAHGLFMDGAPELFAAPELESVLVSNSMPPFRVGPDARAKLKIFDAGPAIAKAVIVCHQAI